MAIALGGTLVFTGCPNPTSSSSSPSKTVNSVVISPKTATAARGGNLAFTAAVSVSGGAAKTVTWAVSGNTSAATKITPIPGDAGKASLAVALDETAATVTVTVTSTVNTGKKDTAAVTITGNGANGTVNSVTVSPKTVTVAKGSNHQFTAAVSVSGGAAQTVTWSIEGPHHAETTIDNSGMLTIALAEAASSLTVQAVSTVDNSKKDTATVTVGAAEQAAVNSVTVSPKTVTVAKGGNQPFTAAVSVSGGAAQTVTWSIEGSHHAETTIDNNGMLTIALAEAASSLTVKVTSTVDTGKFDTATITVGAAEQAAVNSVTVSPKTVAVAKGGNQQFAAVVSVSGGAAQTVTWSIEGPHHAETTIDNSGMLTIAPAEAASSLTVKVTSTVDPGKFDTATVTIEAIHNMWLVGAMNTPTAWTLPGTVMTEQADGTFTWAGTVQANDEFRFSSLDTTGWPETDNGHNGDNRWWGHWYAPAVNDTIVTTGTEMSITYYHYTKTEHNWKFSTAGYYRITVDPNELKMVVAAAPVIQSAAIPSASPNTLVLTFSKPVTIAGTAPYGFTLSSGSAINVAGGGGSIASAAWTLTLSRAVISGETITLTYSGSAVVDNDGNNLAAISSAYSVTNNVGLTSLPTPAQPSLSAAGAASWTALSDETNVQKYTVELIKDSTVVTSAEVLKGAAHTRDFASAIRSGGTGSYTVKVTAIAGGGGFADSSASPASAALVVTPLKLADFVWADAANAAGVATLADNDAATITSSAPFTIPADKTLIIPGGKTVTAGSLKLGAGTWKASNAAVTLAVNAVTLGSHASPGFGNGDGGSSAVLTGGAAATNTFTASGAVTLGQNGNSLTITGTAAADTLTFGDTARIYVKAGESVTISSAKLVTGNYLDLGPGTWTATSAGADIKTNEITLGNNATVGFGNIGGGAVTLSGGASDTGNTFTATGAKVTLGQSGAALTINGTAASLLTLGFTAKFYVNPDGIDTGLTITGAKVKLTAGAMFEIAPGKNVAAGSYLHLGGGYWRTGSEATVGGDKIALTGPFGQEVVNWTKTVLFPNGANTAEFTASGAAVYLWQGADSSAAITGDVLHITGGGAGATLTTAANSLIIPKSNLRLMNVTLDISVADTSYIPLENGQKIWMHTGSKIVLDTVTGTPFRGDNTNAIFAGDAADIRVGTNLKIVKNSTTVGAILGCNYADGSDEWNAIRKDNAGEKQLKKGIVAENAQNVWLIGTANSWTLPGTLPTVQADGSLVWDITVTAVNSEFRFGLLDTTGWSSNQWGGHWYAPNTDSKPVDLGADMTMNYYIYTDVENKKWVIAETGTYRITVDPYADTVKVVRNP
jgi:hypothetical protein